MLQAYSYRLSFFLLLLPVAGLWAQEDFRKTAPAPLPAPQVQIGNSVQTVLPNGLRVIVVENHKLPTVNFQLFFDLPLLSAGEKAGLSALAGELLGSGTTQRSKAELDEAIDFIGATLSTSGSGIFASSLVKHQDKLLELMAEVLFKPSFAPAEFEKIKKQTLSGLAAAKTNPNAISANVNRVVRFGKTHPYGEITTKESVEKITLDDCRQFYQTYFKPNLAYLIVVGDIKPAAAQTIATKYFGTWSKGSVAPTTFPTPKPLAKAEVDFVDVPGSVQSVISLTYPIELKPNSPDLLPATLMNTMLGGGSSARLYLNLREDKGYTYGAYSSLDDDREVGYFSAGASVRNAVTDSAIVEMLKELNRLRDEKVSAKELADNKAEIAGAFARSLESPQTIARFALNIARYNLPKDYYASYLQRLAAITPEQIQTVARKYLLPSQANIVVVGNQDEVAAKLSAFGKVNFRDSYGNLLTPAAPAPTNVDAQGIIEKYLQAIGGRAKLSAIQDALSTMSAEVQGQNLAMTLKQKAPNKLAQTVTMNGMTLVETRFDGTAGYMSQMGQKQELDAATAQQVKRQAAIFPELQFKEPSYKLTFQGTENVNNQPAYKIGVELEGGTKMTLYYDQASSLRVKMVMALPQGALITEYADYRPVEGILMPFRQISSGMMPFPLEMKVLSIAFNQKLPDADFSVK